MLLLEKIPRRKWRLKVDSKDDSKLPACEYAFTDFDGTTIFVNYWYRVPGGHYLCENCNKRLKETTYLYEKLCLTILKKRKKLTLICFRKSI